MLTIKTNQWTKFKYPYWSLKTKLLIISALFILLSVFIVSALSYMQYTKDFEMQSAQKMQQTIEQMAINLEAYLDDLFRLSLFPYRNDRVMSALEMDGPLNELEELEKTWIIEDYLDEIMVFPRQDILRVFFIAENDIYTSGRMQATIDPAYQVEQFEWYQEALQTQESIFVPAHLEQLVKSPKHIVFSIVRQIRSIKDSENVLGVIKVDANYRGIENIADRIQLGNHGALMILDQNGSFVYHRSLDKQESQYQTFASQFLQSDHPAYFKTKFQQEDYLVNAITVPRANWTIIMMSDVKELNQQALKTRNFAFLLAILCSLLSILFFYYVIVRFLKPLLLIVKLMKQINLGNLSVYFPDQRHDEIGYLGSSFNEMVARIQTMLTENVKLVEEVYQTKLLHQETKILALFQQIKPHFMYNTLNMISMQIQNGKDEQAVSLIQKLSYMMRHFTKWEEEITLERELELLDSYLSIQSNRFGDRLSYSIRMDQSMYHYRIPAFLLQPIVENAVIHGCETKKQQTTIHIYHEEHADKLVLVVEDDGQGMEETQYQQLLERLNHVHEISREVPSPERRSKGMGIGLVNIQKRVKLKYGEEYGLTIHSTLHKGTTVRIVLPKLVEGGTQDV